MKPIRLRMQAFGPYAREAEIDFRSIQGGGLFLIHGQTGAGKTSILDGLCFALFGRASGAERTPEGLRSDLAGPELATETTFEFALGNAVYRILRRPRQLIKKSRGEGLTNSPPRGDLWKLATPVSPDRLSELNLEDGPWDLIASGDRKTDEKIAELLGMTEEQFRQVVVLPQGQFRRFLQAGSDQREALLEKLFRSSRFRRLTEELEERAKEIASAISLERQGCEAQLQALEVATVAELEARIQEVANRRQELEAGEATLDERHRDASKRLDAAKAAAKVLSDHAACEAKRKTLEERRSTYELDVVRLEAEQRARPVLTLDAQVSTMERELGLMQEDQKNETAKLNQREGELKTLRATKTSLDERLPEIERWSAEREGLRSLYANAKSLKEAIEKEKTATIALASAGRLANEAETTLARHKDKRAQLESQAQDVQATVSRLDAFRAERDLRLRERTELISVQKSAQKLDTLMSDRATAATSFASTEANFAKTDAKAKKAKIAYYLSQAARLAMELSPNSACPVCGSLEHPAPAKALDEAPTLDAVELLEQEVARCAEQVAAAKLRLSQIDSDIERCHEEIARRFPNESNAREALRLAADAVETAIAKLDQDIANAEEAGRRLSRLRVEIAQVEKEISQGEVTLRSTLAARESASSELAATQARVKQLEEIVPTDRRDPDAIMARGLSLKTQIEEFQNRHQDINRRIEQALQEASASRATLETLSRQGEKKALEHRTLQADRDAALLESRFESLAACRAAGLEPREARDLDRKRRDFEQELATVESRLAELRLERASLQDWALDLEVRRSEFETLDRERAERKAERLTLEDRSQLLAASRERLAEQLERIAALEDRYRVFGKLSEVSAGRPPNLSRVNFQRYVLASQLDEVLVQASRRLYEMSRGQFILRRARQIDDKRRSAGLDLEVEDAFTGTARPTASLSGGEGFLASLALALGLADVVQSHLGGIRLDAVFIDEGFGTLDPEALDAAMKILGELQAGGRLVGIISHVPELKDQIARRLYVKKSAEGSVISWQVAVS